MIKLKEQFLEVEKNKEAYKNKYKETKVKTHTHNK